MPTVTAIKQQVKKKGRYSIFVDGKFAFGLSELGLINTGVRVGKEFSTKELEELRESAATDKNYNRVLNLLARRPRSEWEVRDYLKRRGSPTLQIDEILNRLSIAGLLNDKAFAKAWVENRRLLKPSSRRRLQLELRKKHISQEIIDGVLDDESNDKQALKELIVRKSRQTKYKDQIKIMQYLSRQGFSYGDIKDALKEYQETIGEAAGDL